MACSNPQSSGRTARSSSNKWVIPPPSRMLEASIPTIINSPCILAATTRISQPLAVGCPMFLSIQYSSLLTIMRSNRMLPEPNKNHTKRRVCRSRPKPRGGRMGNLCLRFESNSDYSRPADSFLSKILQLLAVSLRCEGTFLKANSIRPVAEQWSTDLQGIEHTHTIHLHQNVFSQIVLTIHTCGALQQVWNPWDKS